MRAYSSVVQRRQNRETVRNIYRLRAESFINVAQRKHRGKNQIVRKIHRKSKEQLYQQKRNRG